MRQFVRLAYLLVCCVLPLPIAHSAPPAKTLTVSVQGGGSVSIDPAGGSYPRGTEVTLTALASDGWNFDHWKGATIDGSASNPQIITMYNNYEVIAVFTQPTGASAVRATDAQIQVVDSQGQPVSGVSVQVDMTEIDFAFGTALTADGLNYPEYRNWVKDNYNWAVAANEAKWYANEPAQGLVSYADADDMYAFCLENGIRMRGHTVFWAVPDFVQQWVQDLGLTALQAAVDERLNSAVNHYKGKYEHWDVNNEMVHGSFFLDKLGASIRPYMFNRVKEIDPNALTFVNDYNIISGGYATSQYITQINDLLAAGAQIDAIGVQCHFSGGDTMEEVVQRLNAVASIGLPIWVTEYDYVDADPAARADYLESFYRTAFGHPSVEGIIMWGFWADDHWRGADAALLDSDFSVNAAGQRYLNLLAEWTTHATGATDAGGSYAFNGYYGDYQVTLDDGSLVEVHTVSMPKAGGTNPVFVLQLGSGAAPDGSPPAPDPASWDVSPAGVSRDVVAMAATAATDPSGVEYYFSNLQDPSHDSGWQNSPIYHDSGLTPNTSYSYEVIARDKSLSRNTTSRSLVATGTTLPDDGNLIVNEGFEYGSVAGWNSFASASIRAVDTPSHSGTFSAHAQLRVEAYDGITQQLAGVVTNGTTYRASAWMRLENAASSPVNMTIRQTDQTGTSYFGVASATATDSAWVELSGTFTANYTGSLSDLTLYFEGPPAGVNYYLDDVSFLPQTPATGGDLYVASIDMSTAAKGPNVTATATVRVVDENGVGVEGATVTGDWSGSASGTASGTTDALGVATVASPSARNGTTFTFTVTEVVLSGFTYQPALNVETSDTVAHP